MCLFVSDIQESLYTYFFRKIGMSNADPGSSESLTYLNDYFDFNPSENRTYDRVFGNKAIFTNELLWRTFQEGVYDSLGPVSFVVMFQVGQKYGIKIGDRAHEKFPDVQQATNFLEKYGLLAGWGRFRTSQFVISGGKLKSKVKVTVEDAFSQEPIRKLS